MADEKNETSFDPATGDGSRVKRSLVDCAHGAPRPSDCLLCEREHDLLFAAIHARKAESEPSK